MSSTRPRKPKASEEPVNKNPVYIPVGTSVTARWYRAFCTATVRSVRLNLMITLRFDDGALGVHQLTQDEIEGDVYEVGTKVKAKHPIKNRTCRGKIVKVKDKSEYVVVFNDGDMLKLDRSKVRLLGHKSFDHFTLNNFPIVDLKAFVAPVVVINGVPKDKKPRNTNRNARRNVSETIVRPPSEEESKNGQAEEQATRASNRSQQGQGSSIVLAANLPPQVPASAEGFGQRAENGGGYAAATATSRARQPSSWDKLRSARYGVPPKKRLRPNEDENNNAVAPVPPVLQLAAIPVPGPSNIAASRGAPDIPPEMKLLAERTGMTQAHLHSLLRKSPSFNF